MAFRISLDTIMKISLLPFGISVNLNKRFEKFYKIFIALLSLTVSFCQIKNYSTLDSNVYIMDNTVYVGAMIFVINTFWISRIHKPQFLRILSKVEEDLKDEQFAEIVNRILKKYFLNVGIIFICLFAFMISLPIVGAIITKDKLGSTETLLFPCWFPWRVDSTRAYIFTLGLQFGSAGILYSFAICSSVLVTCFMALTNAHCEYFEFKVTRMGTRIDLLHRRGRKAAKNFQSIEPIIATAGLNWYIKKTRNSSSYVNAELKNILHHYQYVHSLIADIVECCNFYAANSLVIFFDGTVLLSAMLLEDEGNGMYRIKILSTELFACLIFALYCYMGEIVIHLNTFFRDTLYNTKWYIQSPDIRKLFIVFMEQTHYSFKLTAFNMYVIELSFFAYVTKVCFSILQFLIKVRRKSLF